MAQLGTAEEGLRTDQAIARLKRQGLNALPEETAVAPVRLLLRQFASPLVLILLFGAVLSGFDEWLDAHAIRARHSGVSKLDEIRQEYRASAASRPTIGAGRAHRAVRVGAIQTDQRARWCPETLCCLSAAA